MPYNVADTNGSSECIFFFQNKCKLFTYKYKHEVGSLDFCCVSIERQSSSNVLETMVLHCFPGVALVLTFLSAMNCVSEAEKQNRMVALLERLHAKHNASRPWQETSKVVRQAMVRQLYFISL